MSNQLPNTTTDAGMPVPSDEYSLTVGPGGSAEKPVGLVWLSVAAEGGEQFTRSVHLPGGRADVRDRATTVAMHMIRRAFAATGAV